MSLGLQHGKNHLSQYSNDWPIQFKDESNRILNACGGLVLAIEHVGSTSVHGLVSKPIIDIAAGVASLDVAEKMQPEMQSIGYDYPGDIGIPGDRIFGRDPGFRLFLVHVVVHEQDQWNRYISFRESLRNNQRLAAEYAKLKAEIVEKYPTGRAVYTEQKTDFINRVLEQQL